MRVLNDMFGELGQRGHQFRGGHGVALVMRNCFEALEYIKLRSYFPKPSC